MLFYYERAIKINSIILKQVAISLTWAEVFSNE